MAPNHFSDTTKATPETIWETCFAPMTWESWDVDVNAVLEPSGGCENGTTFIFDMKTGQKVNCILSDTVKNEKLTFSGGMMGGLIHFTGNVLLTPLVDDSNTTTTTTKVDYTFEMTGFLGGLMNLVANKAIVDGTKNGLDNIIRMSNEAQEAAK